MLSWSRQEQESLRNPRTRAKNMQVSTAERITFSGVNEFEFVDDKILLEEVQRVERKLCEMKKKEGIRMIPCGESQDGIISGGSTEHVVEHAVCVVLELLSPINEGACGLTTDIGWAGEFRNRRYVVSISPPPSISLDRGTEIMNDVIKEIQRTRGHINLESVARNLEA